MKKTLILSVSLLMAAACSLDRAPLDQETVDTFYRDEAQLQIATNYFYAALMPDYKTIYNFSVADLYFSSDKLDKLQLGGKNRNTPSVDSDGRWDWSTLRYINETLENMDKCTDEAIARKYSGLCYFFRAYFYFLKLRDFGDVPWYDHSLTTTDPDLYRARDSRDFIAGKILEDLDKAIDMLPAEKQTYRITKWEALAVKSRVALFEGTWHKYHTEKTYEKDADYYLDIAAKAAKSFIETAPYHIYNTGKPASDYNQLFCTGLTNEEEVMLGRNFSLDLQVSHFASRSTFGDKQLAVNKKFVDMFLMADGTRFTDKAGWATKEFYDEMTGRDPRLAQIIRCPGYHLIDDATIMPPSFANSLTGYNCCKFAVSATKVGPGEAWSGEDGDLPLFRAAEVYLNYAEAQAERSDYAITQADIDLSIKPLRDRAGMPNLNLAAANANPDDNYLGSAQYGYPNVGGANKGVILEIRRERAVELAQELDFRWYDLMRWKAGNCMTQELVGMYFPGYGEYDLDKDGSLDLCVYKGAEPATTATSLLKVDSGAALVFSNGTSGNVIPFSGKKRLFDEERDYLYPIPTNDLENNTQLTQNDGWDVPEPKKEN